MSTFWTIHTLIGIGFQAMVIHLGAYNDWTNLSFGEKAMAVLWVAPHIAFWPVYLIAAIVLSIWLGDPDDR